VAERTDPQLGGALRRGGRAQQETELVEPALVVGLGGGGPSELQ
jgi:hypothetical protein